MITTEDKSPANISPDFFSKQYCVLDDKEAILSIIPSHPLILKYASSRLRDDIDAVRRVIRYDGYCLKYASDRLRKDRSLIFETIRRGTFMLDEYYNFLENDREIVEAMAAGPYPTVCNLDKYRDDEEVMKILVEACPPCIKFIGNKLVNNKEFGISLAYGHYSRLSPILRGDYDIALIGMKHDVDNLKFVPRQLFENYDFLHEVSKLVDLRGYLPDNLKLVSDITKWTKGQVEIRRGNGLSVYYGDPDISISHS